jgi:hypothetical protein
MLTKPENTETLKGFYRRIQPGGKWKHISKDIPITMTSVSKGFFGNWIAGAAFIWGTTFGIGSYIFGYHQNALLLFAVALLGALWIWFKNFKN